MSLTLEDLATGTGHERVVFCRGPAAGYRGVIAVHSAAAGPADPARRRPPQRLFPGHGRGVVRAMRAAAFHWSEPAVSARIEAIYDTLLAVLRLAEAEGIPPHAAADRLAGERLTALEAERRGR